MSGSYEQPGSDALQPATETVGGMTNIELSMAEPSLAGNHMGPQVKTWESNQQAGDEAYALAREHERVHGLDAEAAYMYEEATHELMGVVWRGPQDKINNPINELHIAFSLAKQAKAIEQGVVPGQGVDEEAILQATASKTLRSGLLRLMEEGELEVEASGGTMNVDTTEIVAESAVEAAKEAGTDEHVLVAGIGKVDESTPHELEVKGEAVVVNFIREHSKEPKHGADFIASTADHVEHEITGIHELPVAA